MGPPGRNLTSNPAEMTTPTHAATDEGYDIAMEGRAGDGDHLKYEKGDEEKGSADLKVQNEDIENTKEESTDETDNEEDRYGEDEESSDESTDDDEDDYFPPRFTEGYMGRRAMKQPILDVMDEAVIQLTKFYAPAPSTKELRELALTKAVKTAYSFLMYNKARPYHVSFLKELTEEEVASIKVKQIQEEEEKEKVERDESVVNTGLEIELWTAVPRSGSTNKRYNDDLASKYGLYGEGSLRNWSSTSSLSSSSSEEQVKVEKRKTKKGSLRSIALSIYRSLRGAVISCLPRFTRRKMKSETRSETLF